MYLFLDVETTGKFDFNAPSNASHQPRITEIAVLLVDKEKKSQAKLECLIKPNDWFIPEEVIVLTGITTEQCMTYGINIETALETLIQLAKNSSMIIGHNLSFDLRMINREAQLINPAAARFEDTYKSYCTMQNSTKLCKIQSARGYKWPKLEEAYRILLDKELKGAHRAMVDVKACRDVFFKIQELTSNVAVEA
jgi:DNA polymerase-3 subunit epsilon